MKCKCPTETHGHKAGKCNNLATEPDRIMTRWQRKCRAPARPTTSHPSISHGGNATALRPDLSHCQLCPQKRTFVSALSMSAFFVP